MAKEIEHKYKVINDNYKPLIVESYDIMQGYLSKDKHRTVRIRLVGDNAFITVKGLTVIDCRNEFEYSISVEDAKIMLDELCIKPLISKTRNIVNFDHEKWEIDEFHGALQGLRLAEIELPFSEYKYSLPDFVGEDVTNNSLYYNSNIGNPSIKYV